MTEPAAPDGAAPNIDGGDVTTGVRALTADELRALPYGSAVLTSGHVVWVKYAMHDSPEAAHEWGRCDKVSIGGFFRDSDWLVRCSPVLIYTYTWPCDGKDGHDRHA